MLTTAAGLQSSGTWSWRRAVDDAKSVIRHATARGVQMDTSDSMPAGETTHTEASAEALGLSVPAFAFLLAVASGLSLPFGAVVGIKLKRIMEKNENDGQIIAATMAFGAGALLFAVTVELYGHALHEVHEGLMSMLELNLVMLFALTGAAFYIWVSQKLKEYFEPDAADQLEDEPIISPDLARTNSPLSPGLARTTTMPVPGLERTTTTKRNNVSTGQEIVSLQRAVSDVPDLNRHKSVVQSFARINRQKMQEQRETAVRAWEKIRKTIKNCSTITRLSSGLSSLTNLRASKNEHERFQTFVLTPGKTGIIMGKGGEIEIPFSTNWKQNSPSRLKDLLEAELSKQVKQNDWKKCQLFDRNGREIALDDNVNDENGIRIRTNPINSPRSPGKSPSKGLPEIPSEKDFPLKLKHKVARDQVTKLEPGGQGSQVGVKVGWRCHTINGEPYNEQLLDYLPRKTVKDKLAAREVSYTVVFLKDDAFGTSSFRSVLHIAMAQVKNETAEEDEAIAKQRKEEEDERASKAQLVALEMFAGLLIDGIPEGLLMGIMAAEGHLTPVLIISLFLANFPEAFASSSLLVTAKWNVTKILAIWSGLCLLVGSLTGASCWLLLFFFPNFTKGEELPHYMLISTAIVEGVTGGAMIACIASVMLPEAFEKAGEHGHILMSSGFMTVCGFLVAVALKANLG
jgi:zinc transporter ZupT